MTTLKEKLIYAFNTFFGDFINHAKTSDDTIKKRLKKRYRVIDRSANAILLEFCEEASKADVYDALSKTDTDPFSESNVLDMHVAKAMPLKDVLDKCDWDLGKKVKSDVCVMCGIAKLYSEYCEENHDEDVTIDVMFERFVRSVDRAQMGLSYDELLRDILDDEMTALFRGILVRISPEERDIESVDEEGSGMDNILSQMKNCKLGEIAEEISQTIDKEKLSQAFSGEKSSMEDIVKNLMSGENAGMIGDLVQQVGDKITKKIQAGDIREEDLLKDAFNLMGKMKNFGTPSQSG